MIQNRAASSLEQTARNNGKPYSVSGKIDRNYNYNYRQYLKKRCMIADYDNRSGGRQRSAVKYPPSSQHVLEAPCCTTDCSGTHRPSDILTYKRSNWGFRKQGAVDNSLYIATKKVFANPCCCVCYQQLRVKTEAELNNNDIGRYLAYGESRGIIVSFSQLPPGNGEFYYSIWVSLSDCNKPFYDTQQGGLSTNLPVAVKPKSVSNPWTRPATSCGNHSREEPGVPNPPLQAVDPGVIIGKERPKPIGGRGETDGIVIPQ